jgi:hypothetical protein
MQVDREDPGDEFGRALLQARRLKYLCGWDENIDSAESTDGCLNQTVQVSRLRHITVNDEHACRGQLGQFFEAAAIPREYDDLRSFREKPLNDGPPEHSTGARYHSHLVQQTLSHPNFLDCLTRVLP